MSHREKLREERAIYVASLRAEAERLATSAAALGAERVILFGSLTTGEPGLLSDLDLLIVWDTPLDYLTRTVEIYKRLAPRGPVDLLIYTPREMREMVERPFIRMILEEGETLYEATV
jgi:uncharacterized protein